METTSIIVYSNDQVETLGQYYVLSLIDPL